MKNTLLRLLPIIALALVSLRAADDPLLHHIKLAIVHHFFFGPGLFTGPARVVDPGKDPMQSLMEADRGLS